MANEVAVAKRADAAPNSNQTHFPYFTAEPAGERMIQAVSRWAGITVFFVALGSLGVWVFG